MRTAITFVFLLMLAACKPPMTDEQIAAMSNDELCAAVQGHPEDIRLVTFMGGRNLQCHPTQITCKKAGFKAGSKKFSDCVSILMQSEALDKQQAQINAQKFGQALGAAMSQYGQSLQQNNVGYIQPAYQAPAYVAPARPAQTNCTVTPGNATFPQSQVNCRSY
jgi:hypothetical protein